MYSFVATFMEKWVFHREPCSQCTLVKHNKDNSKKKSMLVRSEKQTERMQKIKNTSNAKIG